MPCSLPDFERWTDINIPASTINSTQLKAVHGDLDVSLQVVDPVIVFDHDWFVVNKASMWLATDDGGGERKGGIRWVVGSTLL